MKYRPLVLHWKFTDRKGDFMEATFNFPAFDYINRKAINRYFIIEELKGGIKSLSINVFLSTVFYQNKDKKYIPIELSYEAIDKIIENDDYL